MLEPIVVAAEPVGIGVLPFVVGGALVVPPAGTLPDVGPEGWPIVLP
jgi:hypothetical protein